MGALPPRAWREPRSTKASSRFRSSCCRRWAAARRCEASRAGASAIGTACSCRASGESWSNRFLDTAVFFDAGKVAASKSDLDLTGLKTDYGFGVRFHGPLATAAAGRGGEEQRRHWSSSSPPARPSEADSHGHHDSRPTRTGILILGRRGRRAGRLRRRPSRRASIPTIPSRANRNRRTRRRQAQPDPDRLRDGLQPVRHLRLRAVRHAGAERQHDRRSAGLELVHQPNRDGGHHRRTDRPRHQHGRAARPVALGPHQGEDRPAPIRASPRGMPKARPGSSNSTRRTTRTAPPARSPSRPSSSGRSATTRSRAISRRSIPSGSSSIRTRRCGVPPARGRRSRGTT